MTRQRGIDFLVGFVLGVVAASILLWVLAGAPSLDTPIGGQLPPTTTTCCTGRCS